MSRGIALLRDGVGKLNTVHRVNNVSSFSILPFRFRRKRANRKNVVITIASTSRRGGIFSIGTSATRSVSLSRISVNLYKRVDHFVWLSHHYYSPFVDGRKERKFLFLGRSTLLDKKISVQDFFMLLKVCCRNVVAS